MKKLIVIVFVVLVSIPAFSQIKFGIKVGAATATVPAYSISTGANNIEAVKNANWGLQAGAFLRLSLFGIYLQPEVVFASTSYDYNVSTITGSQVLSQKFNRLNIPVLIGFKLGPLRINAGPSASI